MFCVIPRHELVVCVIKILLGEGSDCSSNLCTCPVSIVAQEGAICTLFYFFLHGLSLGIVVLGFYS